MKKFLGTLLFTLLALIPKIFSQNTVVSEGSNWKYFDQGNIYLPEWKNDTLFNDSSWAMGNAELGYGDGDEATTVGYGNNATNRYITTYFRKKVTINYQASINCKIKFDDGCIVFFNGIEVFRNNLPTGTISPTTLAINATENLWIEFTIPASYINQENNFFAVEIHQNKASSTDLSFDFEAILSPPPGIYINEILASNNSITLPNYTKKDDYIEIWNNTTTAYNLSNHYISDDVNNIQKYRLPISNNLIIPANAYFILICSGNPQLASNHLPFNLSSQGESIILTSSSGTSIIDSITFPSQRSNISFGRNPNNYILWKYMTSVTPKNKNSSTNLYDEILPPPTFSHISGFYTSNFNLSLSTSIPGSIIYYTLDGSDPDPNNLNGKTFQYKIFYPEYSYEGIAPEFSESYISYQYNMPIALTNKSNSPNKVSTKASAFGQPNYMPSSLIKKANIVRAIVTKPQALPSDILTNTYFINPNGNQNTLPIFSLITSEKHLFDYTTGMYTPGYEYERNFPLNASHCADGNYSLDFERDGSLEYFKQSNLEFNQNIKFEINGTCSRTAPRKSIRLKSNTVFPENLFNKYPLKISEDLVLRNAGNLWDRILFLDAYYQDLVSHLDIATQAATPCVVYLNGEYWGIHDLRERYDDNYISNTYNVSKDSIDLLKIDLNYGPFVVKNGDDIEYNALKNFIETNDFSNQNSYNLLVQKVEMSNYIDYQIASIFSGVWDWPNNNMKIWRYKNPQNIASNKYMNGKWRFMLYDMDSGVGVPNYYTDPTIERAKNNDINLDLFEKVLANNTFRNQFIIRFCDLLNTAFLPSRTIPLLNVWKNIYQDDLNEHISRWNSPNPSVLNNDLNQMSLFMNLRPNFLKEDLRINLSLSSRYNLTVSVQDTLHGYVRVNTINIHPSTPGVPLNYKNWTGEYFANIPISLRAKPKVGYKFKHWIYNNTILTDSVLTITPTTNRSYTAVFEQQIVSDNPFPIAKTIDRCGYTFSKWESNNTAGTTPPNMAFVFFNQLDPTLNASIEGYTNGLYNLSTRTRINGLGDNGLSFINTSNEEGNIGYPGRKLGGAILALNTTNQDSLFLSWTGRTIIPNTSEYKIRLQYRIGDLLPFNDLLNENNQIIEYNRSSTPNHSTNFLNIKLPSELMNKPYIQILWRYYYSGVGTGARDELAIDDIQVVSKKYYPYLTNQSNLISEFGSIESKATINPNQLVKYKAAKSIVLNPGFNTTNQALFLAEINDCNN